MMPNPRVAKAFCAMREIGIPKERVTPVLKNLIILYADNWELIEDENYRALADAIFDTEETEAVETKKKFETTEHEEDLDEAAQVHEEPRRPIKRLRLRHQERQASPFFCISSPELGVRSFKIPKVEGNELPETHPQHQSLLPQNAVRERTDSNTSACALRFKESNVETGIIPFSKQKVLDIHALIKPKDEPFTDDMPKFEVPVAVIRPEPIPKRDSSIGNGSIGEPDDPEPTVSQCVDAKDNIVGISASSSERRNNCKLAKIPNETTANLEIASSLNGDVKIYLQFDSSLVRADFRMPSLDAILKLTEDKCLRSCKVLDPNYSVKKLLTDMCLCFLELGVNTSNESQETLKKVTPTVDLIKEYGAADAVGSRGTPFSPSDGSVNSQCDAEAALPQIPSRPPPCNDTHDCTT